MNPLLSETVILLRSHDEASVATAATRLGLLLERNRFRRRGEGTLGDLDDVLGDLAHTELADADVEGALAGLRTHLTERDVRAHPTVVWALGKALDRAAINLIADVAERALAAPEYSDLVYQSLVAVTAIGPGSNKDLFLRASRMGQEEAAQFAKHQLETRSWS